MTSLSARTGIRTRGAMNAATRLRWKRARAEFSRGVVVEGHPPRFRRVLELFRPGSNRIGVAR